LTNIIVTRARHAPRFAARRRNVPPQSGRWS
jgi:hypothetical protein